MAIGIDGSISADNPTDGRSEHDATLIRKTVDQTGNIDLSTAPDVGNTSPTTVIKGLTPQDFVRYDGASGDFSPIHYDEHYAKALGDHDVSGQGVLMAGCVDSS